ncbi:MAG: recombinase family protein, partial [Chloroflexota bacterium]
MLAFEERAKGKTDLQIAKLLNAKGYRTTGNRGKNRFTKDTVRVMLRNRFYLGELPDAEGGGCPSRFWESAPGGRQVAWAAEGHVSPRMVLGWAAGSASGTR